MTTAVYPGSFDPMTNGHLDMLERGCMLFDQVIVAILNNSEKRALFTVDERVSFIREATLHLKNVEVDSFAGLLADYVSLRNADCIIRGLRSISDFGVEFPMAQMNRRLNPQAVTVFLPANAAQSDISSSFVKDIARHGGPIESLVPLPVVNALRSKFDPGT